MPAALPLHFCLRSDGGSMRSIIIVLLTGLAVAVLPGCTASAPQGMPITITTTTDVRLKQHLQTMGESNYGAFAVSADGRYSYYTYCTDGGGCERVPLNFDALAGCKKLAGSECIVLAHNRVFLRPYHLAS